MLTLYDADRCPYCARVRIVLAEKAVEYEATAIDLADRPAWLYAKNPAGKVPVLEEDGGLVLPESAVIVEYLEERYPEPALLPADPAERALARLRIERFDDRLGRAYYALRRGEEDGRDRLGRSLRDLDGSLEGSLWLTGRDFGLADVAYLPWVLRARDTLDVPLDGCPALERWLARSCERPAVAAEAGVVAGLAR